MVAVDAALIEVAGDKLAPRPDRTLLKSSPRCSLVELETVGAVSKEETMFVLDDVLGLAPNPEGVFPPVDATVLRGGERTPDLTLDN